MIILIPTKVKNLLEIVGLTFAKPHSNITSVYLYRMKTLLLFTISFMTSIAFSQSEEGFFQFHINVKALDTSAQTHQNAEMMRGSQMKLYYAKDLLRVEYKMGKMYETTLVLDKKKNLAMTLTDGMLGKMAVQKDADELDFNNIEIDSNIAIVRYDEYQDILGFKCQKVITNSEGQITTYWLTDEIDISDMGQQMLNPNIPGFPLSFSKVENGMEMTFKASNYSFELQDKDKLFSVDPPEGYKPLPGTTSH